MAQISVDDVRRGLVVFLDPKLMASLGAHCNQDPRDRIAAPHYFLCVVAPDATGWSTWLPCSTKAGPGRVEVPPAFRSGHQRWRQRPCFVTTVERWEMSAKALEAASYGDESIFSARPRISRDFVTEKIDVAA